MSELHKNAFWAYGVILALAIREPLSHVIPHLIQSGFSDWQVQLEVWRLFLFLILIIRFYLGSGLYFDDVYVKAGKGFNKKSYPIDFLSGLFHFLIFFATAVALSLHDRIGNEFSYFLAILLVVLLYDNVWWLASAVSKFDTVKQIREWSNFNNLTAVVCGVCYAVCRLRKDPVFAEHVAIIPVVLFSLLDIKRLIARYEYEASTDGTDMAPNPPPVTPQPPPTRLQISAGPSHPYKKNKQHRAR